MASADSFRKLDFFRTPSVAPGAGLGGHLVAIRVLERPWGPAQRPLGPCSPSDRHHKKSPDIAVA